MKVSIRDIPKEGLELPLSGEEDILSDALKRVELPKGMRVDPGIRGLLRLRKEDANVLLSGHVEATVHVPCSRCLTDCALAMVADLDLVIRPMQTAAPVLEEEFVEEALDVAFIDDDEIDPGEAILQELVLEVPMKPLCKDDCPGLCPRCGALKGSPDCTCPPEEPRDSRWAALAKLKDHMAP